jgi:hypothetical protein
MTKVPSHLQRKKHEKVFHDVPRKHLYHFVKHELDQVLNEKREKLEKFSLKQRVDFYFQNMADLFTQSEKDHGFWEVQSQVENLNDVVQHARWLLIRFLALFFHEHQQPVEKVMFSDDNLKICAAVCFGLAIKFHLEATFADLYYYLGRIFCYDIFCGPFLENRFVFQQKSVMQDPFRFIISSDQKFKTTEKTQMFVKHVCETMNRWERFILKQLDWRICPMFSLCSFHPPREKVFENLPVFRKESHDDDILPLSQNDEEDEKTQDEIETNIKDWEKFLFFEHSSSEFREKVVPVRQPVQINDK